MQGKEFMQNKVWVAGVALLLFFCLAHNAAAQTEDKWQFEATLYGWFTGIDGTIKYPRLDQAGSKVSYDASDILSDLNFVIMGNFVAQRDKWSILADIIYLDMSDSGNTTLPVDGRPVNVGASLGLTSWLLQGGIGYDLMQSDRGVIGVVGGVRYLTVDVDAGLSLQGFPAHRSDSTDVLDGIVGLRGALNLNEHWYIPYYADIGTGDSDLTWQAFAGLGYRFSWGDIKLGYRYLSYELDDDNKLLEDLDLSGPLLGVGFRF